MAGLTSGCKLKFVRCLEIYLKKLMIFGPEGFILGSIGGSRRVPGALAELLNDQESVPTWLVGLKSV